MKITPLVAAASIAAAAAFSSPATAQRTVVAVGVPTGPGWVAYHDRAWHRDWNGPRYWDHPGPHRGYYAWNDGYYRNCSYRWGHHHRRDWHCW